MSTRSTSTQPSTRPGQSSTSNLPVPLPRARSIPQLRRPQPTAPPPLPGPVPLGISRTQSQVPLPHPTTSSSSNTNSKPKPKLQGLSRKPSIPLRPTLPPPRSTITRKASSRVLGSPAIPAGAVSRKTSTSRLAVGLVGSPAPPLGKGKKLLPARSLLNLGIGLPSRSKVNDAAGAGPGAGGGNGSKKDIQPKSELRSTTTAGAIPNRPARVASRPQLRDDRVTQDQIIAPVPGDEQTKLEVLGTDNVFYETDHHKNRIGEGIGMPMPIPPKEVFEARAGPLRRVISRGRGINRLNDLDMDYEQDGPMGGTFYDILVSPALCLLLIW